MECKKSTKLCIEYYLSTMLSIFRSFRDDIITFDEFIDALSELCSLYRKDYKNGKS